MTGDETVDGAVEEMQDAVSDILDRLTDPIQYVDALTEFRIWVNATIHGAQEDIRRRGGARG